MRWAFWWGDHHFTAGHKFMLPWRYKPIPEHHWEMGYPYTARKITKLMSNHMDVVLAVAVALIRSIAAV